MEFRMITKITAIDIGPAPGGSREADHFSAGLQQFNVYCWRIRGCDFGIRVREVPFARPDACRFVNDSEVIPPRLRSKRFFRS